MMALRPISASVREFTEDAAFNTLMVASPPPAASILLVEIDVDSDSIFRFPVSIRSWVSFSMRARVRRVSSISLSAELIVMRPPPVTSLMGWAVLVSLALMSKSPPVVEMLPPTNASVRPFICASALTPDTAISPPEVASVFGFASDVDSADT